MTLIISRNQTQSNSKTPEMQNKTILPPNLQTCKQKLLSESGFVVYK